MKLICYRMTSFIHTNEEEAIAQAKSILNNLKEENGCFAKLTLKKLNKVVYVPSDTLKNTMSIEGDTFEVASLSEEHQTSINEAINVVNATTTMYENLINVSHIVTKDMLANYVTKAEIGQIQAGEVNLSGYLTTATYNTNKVELEAKLNELEVKVLALEKKAGTSTSANEAYTKKFKLVATSMPVAYGNNWAISRIKFYDKDNDEIIPQNITEINIDEVDFTLNGVKVKIKGSYNYGSYNLINVFSDGSMTVWFSSNIPDNEIGTDSSTLFITQEANSGIKYIEFNLSWAGYSDRNCYTFDFYKDDTKILENQSNPGVVKIKV